MFGISIPTVCFPGIGASILIDSASKLNAISSLKFAIFETLTPCAGESSYLVIAGPTETFSTFALTPKLDKVFLSLSAVSSNFFLLFPVLASTFPSKSIGGNS